MRLYGLNYIFLLRAWLSFRFLFFALPIQTKFHVHHLPLFRNRSTSVQCNYICTRLLDLDLPILLFFFYQRLLHQLHVYFDLYIYIYMYIYIYTNLSVDVIVRLPHPRSGDSQGQETFLAPSAKNVFFFFGHSFFSIRMKYAK